MNLWRNCNLSICGVVADLMFTLQTVTLKHKFNTPFQENSFVLKLKQSRSKSYKVSSALPETAASIAVTATIVGVAATLLRKRTESSETSKVSLILVAILSVVFLKMLTYINTKYSQTL